MRVLVVKSSFLNYQKGNTITDPKTIAEILDSPSRVHVIASEHPEPEHEE